jgi:hypothetical protein
MRVNTCVADSTQVLHVANSTRFESRFESETRAGRCDKCGLLFSSHLHIRSTLDYGARTTRYRTPRVPRYGLHLDLPFKW